MLRHLLCLAVVILCVPHASAEPIAFEYRYFLGNPQSTITSTPYSYHLLDHMGGPETASAELGVPTALRSLTLGRGGATITGEHPLINIFLFEASITDLDSGETANFTISGRLTGMITDTTGSTGRLEFLGSRRPIRVGDHLYRIRYDSVDIPSWDALAEPLVINGDITVTQVPEPTTLALATLGVAGCWWVRRRGSRPASRESLPS